MAPSSKSKKKQQTPRKHKEDNVVKLVTRGKVLGQFSQSGFSKLSPLVRVPLEDISEGQGGLREAGHVFLGFIKSGRYILSYTKVDVQGRMWYLEGTESDSDDSDASYGCNYTLYWWEFNLHSKLKLVQQVKLFKNGHVEDHHLLSLYVCEWPNDDSNIAIFGFDGQSTSTDQLMVNLMTDYVWCVRFVTIAPNPPAKPCSQCSAMTTHSDRGVRCLEHGFVLHSGCAMECPFPFQPTLQLKKDKVILLIETGRLVACATYLCPAGEQSQSCQMLYTKRAAPPSGQPSSPPAMLPQGSAEDRHPSTGSPASSPPSSSSLPSSSSQEADLSKPSYIDYKRLHYQLSQPGVAGQDAESFFGHDSEYPFHGQDEDGRSPFHLQATDLKGRGQDLLPGRPRDDQSLCVEAMELDVGHFLDVLLQDEGKLWGARGRCSYNYGFDFVVMEVCPETDTVLIGIGLYWKREERNMRVSWDLSTGLCSVISDLTRELPDYDPYRDNDDRVMPHRKSCVDTVMECSVPESSSHRVNVVNALPNTVMADTERCTWVTRGL